MDNEFEGVEMARRAIQRRKEQAAQKQCYHPNSTYVVRETYTQDGRQQRVATEECPDCGLFRRRVVWEEPLSSETVRRV